MLSPGALSTESFLGFMAEAVVVSGPQCSERSVCSFLICPFKALAEFFPQRTSILRARAELRGVAVRMLRKLSMVIPTVIPTELLDRHGHPNRVASKKCHLLRVLPFHALFLTASHYARASKRNGNHDKCDSCESDIEPHACSYTSQESHVVQIAISTCR